MLSWIMGKILRKFAQYFLAFVLLRAHNKSQVESAETSVRWTIVPLGLPIPDGPRCGPFFIAQVIFVSSLPG
jgi:hypothetical protein